MKMKSNIFLLALLAVPFYGCAYDVKRTQYSLPAGANTADVELIALDKYRNTDTIRLSLISRSSCVEKPEIAQVSFIGSAGLFGKKSTYQALTKLPTAKSLNIGIQNTSSSGYVTTNCFVGKSVSLNADKYYQIRVKNWSSRDSNHSGFGCEFDIVEIGRNGQETKLVTAEQQLPICPR